MGNLQNGMFFAPRTSTATNKHPTRSFRSVGSGCRGAEALPKDLDEVRFFCQQTDKKGDIFSHGWRADWLIFHVNSLSQMAKRLELLGITYVVGKIQSQLLFHGPKWLSKVSRLATLLGSNIFAGSWTF